MNRLEKAFEDPRATCIVLFASREQADKVFEAAPDALAVVLLEDGLWGVEIGGVKRAYRLMSEHGGIDFGPVE
jgi:hypothetical protein